MMFNRAIAGWAQDVLTLRKAGLLEIRWIDGDEPLANQALDECEFVFD